MKQAVASLSIVAKQSQLLDLNPDPTARYSPTDSGSLELEDKDIQNIQKHKPNYKSEMAVSFHFTTMAFGLKQSERY